SRQGVREPHGDPRGHKARWTVRYPIVTPQRRSLGIVVWLVSAASLAPRMVAGAEIPFLLHMANATDCVCIDVDGPWLPAGSGGPFAAQTPDPINFYSAEINIFRRSANGPVALLHPMAAVRGIAPA